MLYLLFYIRNFLMLFPEKIFRGILRKLNDKLYSFDILQKKKKSEKLSIFNVKELIKESYSIPQNEYFINNKWYSNGYTIKKYAKFEEEFCLPVTIEHGLHFDDSITFYEVDNAAPAIITASPFRKLIYNEKNIHKEVIPIGPFIKYATPLLTGKNFIKLKKKLGRCLLVMPVHSSVVCELSNNNIESFFDKIKQVAKNYDSVLVCFHWYDIQNKKYKEYIKYGWKIVTAGHENSHLFLSRLRTIFDLSDAVLSDFVGTHVAFALALNKPICLYKSKFNVKTHGRLTYVTTESVKKYLATPIFDKFFEMFSEFQENLSDEQYAFVEPYFGLKCIKTSEEMREIILKYDKLYTFSPDDENSINKYLK